MLRIGNIPVCGNYLSNHPMITRATRSTTCKGCTNRDVVDTSVKAYILDNNPDKLNCKNFRPVEYK